MPELWIPGLEGPHDEFVTRLGRQIKRFAEKHKIEKAVVELELRDGARFKLNAILPEPGFGFVTICPHSEEDEDTPGELIVPIGAIARIELYEADEPEPRLGFSPPETVRQRRN